ncbi:ribosomal protein S18-alanine N-acetyltransferase [Marinomonas algicola]|uniref:ribosomal protein S18-alanine N-acetyltransferase n=1 Tax=Marinomonas algicola TaxID=2773454 RepID=UPI00174B9B15|nr:ribosomal protein S18-alanine N-acetyltransferase [Marinomonas algicola]
MIRKALVEDLNGIDVLDKASNENPWGKKLIKDALESRSNWVIADDKEQSIFAWLTASVVLDESELELIVVHPECRRLGYAKQLIEQWFDEMMGRHVSQFILEVRESNLPAISLYQNVGFVPVGLRKNYYAAPNEHALLMNRIVQESSPI